MLCYTCISLLLQTKDDFRFVIPYVEFAREIKGTRPCILDTSVIIDGRIADVVDTQIVDGQLVIPKFVINELQGIADSSDRMRRSRGRRGLDILNRLRNSETIDVQIFDRDLPEFAGQPVDLKLVALARHLSGKLITNDYNLNKVAQLQDVTVINLNDLANAMKPSFLPGEQISVRVVKAGEEHGQGIGYLDDGTMVVIENGREHIGQQVTIAVTSVIQKSAGRMVFGRFESQVGCRTLETRGMSPRESLSPLEDLWGPYPVCESGSDRNFSGSQAADLRRAQRSWSRADPSRCLGRRGRRGFHQRIVLAASRPRGSATFAAFLYAAVIATCAPAATGPLAGTVARFAASGRIADRFTPVGVAAARAAPGAGIEQASDPPQGMEAEVALAATAAVIAALAATAAGAATSLHPPPSSA